jgi:hypothetical protein
MGFVGNFCAYKDLLAWLSRPPKEGTAPLSHASVLYVAGPPGSGKTHGVLRACEELGLAVTVLDTHCASSFKEFYESFRKLCSSDITTQFGWMPADKVVFLIDELDALTALDRSFATSFHKMLDASSLPHRRIIVTCHQGDAKKLAAGKSPLLELRPAEDGDLLPLLRQHAPHIAITELLSILDRSRGNIGYALNMLQMSQAGSAMDYGRVMEGPTLAKTRPLFLEDPWIAPLRFHENLPAELARRKGTPTAKAPAYIGMLTDLCIWDVLMTRFKGDELTMPTEYIALATSKLDAFPRKAKAGAMGTSDDFTRIFSHLSLEKKNQVALEGADPIFREGLHSYHKTLYDTYIAKKTGRRKTQKLSTE